MRFLLGVFLAVALGVGLPGRAQAEWLEATSPHFAIYANMAPADLKDFGDRLERFDGAVRLIREMDDPKLTDAERLTVYAVGDESAVGRLIGSNDVLGFYFADASGAYAYVPAKEGFFAKRSEMTAQNVFFHEYAHHLQLGRESVALPAWVTEGFAEFFATAEMLDNGDVRIGLPPMYRQWSVHQYVGLSMVEMLSGSLRNATDLQVASLYGRGWLLTHMLNFDPQGRKQLEQYISGIQSGIDPLQSAKAAFGDDPRSLDGRLDKYVRQKFFKTIVIDGHQLPPRPIAIRKLSPAEAAIMDVRLHIPLAGGKKDGAKLAADARKVAQNYPDDPAVLLALAQAEVKAEDYPEAIVAGKRAFSMNPNEAKAATAVGEAEMELGRKSPKNTDWAEVRSWFLKANKLSPESAEPLVYFYRSFAYAGLPPTPSAVKGLEYAVYLAPRDEDLRIEAVRQMVSDGEMKQARDQFAPIAYNLHSGLDWRKKKTVIMDALKSGDRTSALQLLSQEIEKRQSQNN